MKESFPLYSFLCTIAPKLSVFLGMGVLITCSGHSLRNKATDTWSLRDHVSRPHWSEKDKSVPFLVASLPTKVPRSFFVEGLPKAGNQGSQASGTAWACGYFVATHNYKKKHKGANYQCAPAFVYNSLNRGFDQGIEIINALQFLKDHGCADESYAPYRANDFAFKPNHRSRENAAHYRIQGFGRVDYFDLDQVRGHLLQHRPIMVTLVISDNFITFDTLVWKSPQGKKRGRHTMALIGYDDEKELFYFLNSVGTEWGGNGRVAIPYSWFIRLARQAYVLW